MSFLASCLLAALPPAQSQVWIVDDSLAAPADFATVQEAVDAATDGDIVLVRPGLYPSFTIDGKSLRVVGLEEGGHRPYIQNLVFDEVVITALTAGQEVTLQRAHSLFFVPVKWWPVIFIGVGVAMMFVGADA